MRLLGILPERARHARRIPARAFAELTWLSEVEGSTLTMDGASTVLIRLTALSFAILLTACTQYHYIDPQTPEGLDCLKKLDTKVIACETDVKNQQDNFDSLYETQARSTQQCEHFNTLNIATACPPPPSPTKVANYCRSGYREKFVECGGRVEEVK